MKKVLLSAAAFGALTSVALADTPTKLTDTQLNQITAGASGHVDDGVVVGHRSTNPNDGPGAHFTGQKKNK